MDENMGDLLRIMFVGLVSLLSLLGLLQSFPMIYGDALILITILVGGYPIFKEVYYALRSKSITMEVAMTIGIGASMAVGEFFAAMIIVFFTLTAEFIEEFTVEKSRRAIEEIIAVSPKRASIRKDGGEIEVEVSSIEIDDVVIVRPGERIPVDGSVLVGEAFVNQAPITGESIPVLKSVGSDVYSGTIIQGGFLEVRTVKVGKDTTLGKIIKLVEESQDSKAPVQRFADSFASRFVPIVLLIAALFYAFTQNMMSAVSIIIVACPCAVAMATPLAVVASIGKAARKGIIIKGGIHLEKLSRVDTVVVDKTGTLTLGEPRITDVKGFEEHDERDIITLAATAELHSEHHLAKAISRRAAEYSLDVPNHRSCRIVAGKGVICSYDDRTIMLGNRDLMRENNLDIPKQVTEYMLERENEGKTAMIIAHDQNVCGIISVADVVRGETLEGLKRLRALGIAELIMVTGDNRRTAKTIAKELEIDEVFAEMLPLDKLEKVRELVSEGKKVLMVGDGVNDALALTEASVGVAMGAAGTDVAIETADVVLMTDNFRNIAESIIIGRRAFANIKQNIAASIVFNVIGIGLASLGVLNPLIAAAVHALPDIVLFINSSRLLR